MFCFFPYEILCNGDIITFLLSYNCSGTRKFENLHNNFNLQFDLFCMKHCHFIGDLVITNHFSNCGRINFSLIKLPKLDEVCLLHPTCFSFFHKPYHSMHTSNEINCFQILWSDTPFHFLDMSPF